MFSDVVYEPRLPSRTPLLEPGIFMLLMLSHEISLSAEDPEPGTPDEVIAYQKHLSQLLKARALPKEVEGSDLDDLETLESVIEKRKSPFDFRYRKEPPRFEPVRRIRHDRPPRPLCGARTLKGTPCKYKKNRSVKGGFLPCDRHISPEDRDYVDDQFGINREAYLQGTTEALDRPHGI